MKLNKSILGWIIYDFANSSFTTIIVTVVFSVYFKEKVVGNRADGTLLWSIAISLSMFLVAISAPIFGAVADYSRSKKKFLFIMTYVTIIFTGLLFFVDPGDILKGIVFFVIANFAFNTANVFYNAFLPEITTKKEIGRISGFGWAFGYIGGLTSLLLVFPFVETNIKLTFPLVALFFLIFSIFTFFWLKEVSRPSKKTNYFKTAYKRIKKSFKNIRKIKELQKFIISYFIYNDAIVTVIAFGAIYGKTVFDMTSRDLLIYFIIIQFSSMFGAFFFGFVLDRIGAKKTLTITLIIWIATVIIAYVGQTINHFYLVGLLAGIAMGSSQSSSRSMLALLTPDDKKAEFFGFYAFSGKLAAISGPLAFGVVKNITGSHRYAILSILIFFLTGGAILQFVNENKGKKDAETW